MKSNFFKYIFIIFVILIVVIAFFIINRQDKEIEQNTVNSESTEQKQIKDIRLGVAQFDTINPLLTKNKNLQDITKLIFEPLVDLSQDYKAIPALATEWAKQDATTYIIKLRENVKWSNGERFTSADVQFTFDRLKENTSIYSKNVQDVTALEIVDDYTVKIYLDKEIPFFEYNLTFPILSKTFYDSQDYNNTTIVPVGTGMYKVSDVQGTYITLTQNASWWNREKELSLEKIIVNIYETVGELYNSFKIGNVDVISTTNTNIQEYIGTIGYVPKEVKGREHDFIAFVGELYNSFKIGNVDVISTTNTNIQEYIGTIGYVPKEVKGREHDFIAFNMQNYFLAKPEVRKAISYSIDKNNIVSSVYGNKYYTSSFPLDYGSWVYQEQEVSSGYNLEQAKQILVDNGWVFRNKTWQKTENYKTQSIALNLIIKASNANHKAVAQNIKTQLANQGIIIGFIKSKK